MNLPGRLVSVVIPTFNRRSFLQELIDPLLADSCTGEVIVVVDGCHDGSMELLAEWSLRQPRVKSVYQVTAGPAAARQRGVEEARFDVVLLLDDDVMSETGLVSAHSQWHVDSSNRLVLGYMPVEIAKPRVPGQAPTILYGEDYENTCRLYEVDSHQILRNLWAGNISMRRADALQISLRVDGVLSYHEDMRFGIRCQQFGVETVFDRTLVARHRHTGNLWKLARDARRSGHGRAELLHEFPHLSEDLNPLIQLSTKEKLVLRLFGAPAICVVAAPISMILSFLAGHARLWKTEIVFARVLRLLELSSEFRRTSAKLEVS